MSETDEIKALLQQALDKVRDLDARCDRVSGDYKAAYEAVGELGKALGHPRIARPVSAAIVMQEYIQEVRELVAQYEPQRLKDLASLLKEGGQLR